MKVIHILGHSPADRAYESGNSTEPPKTSDNREQDYAVKIDKFPFWVLFSKMDFHAKMAHEIQNLNPPFTQECWRPYFGLEDIYEKEIENVIHKNFPSNKVSVGKYNFGEWSSELCNAIYKEISLGNVLFNLHGLHNHTINRILLNCDLVNVPVVATQRGGNYPEFLLKKNPLFFFQYIIEKYKFPAIDKFQFQSKTSFNYFNNKLASGKSTLFQDGIDFKFFYPVSKEEARKKIGFSKDRKLILYVGTFTKNKGVDSLISMFNILRKEFNNLDLILVGGSEKDSLFNLVKSSGAKYFTRLDRRELRTYYSAADVHVYPSDNDSVINFAGISNANIESLACGTPIFTSQLKHFFGNKMELNKIGMEYTTIKNSVSSLAFILNNPDNFSECRNIAEKYYNREKNAKKSVEMYLSLFNHYKKGK